MDYFFKLVILSSACLVFLSGNPVHSVLFLILVFVNGSGLILKLGFEFLSLVLLVVYVGAIAVLFLFIVMMMNLKSTQLRQSLHNYYPFGIILLFMLFFQLKAYWNDPFFWVVFEESYRDWSFLFFSGTNINQLGEVIYTYYYLAFFLSGYLLLVAMIGAIYLTYVKKNILKKQEIYKQVSRRKEESLRYWKG